MGPRIRALLAATLLLLAGSCANLPPRPLLPVTANQWHEDLAYFARELPRRHKNAFHHVSRDSFERAVARLDARVATLSDAQIYCELRRITAAIGDGHTGLMVPTNFHRYGIAIRPFGDGYRVARVVPEGRAIDGGRLVGIGGVPIAEAVARLAAFVAQDENPWYVRANTLLWMIVPESLVNAGLAADTLHATYTVQDSLGHEVNATLTPMPLGVAPKWVTAAVDTPLYLRQRRGPLWFEPLPRDSCVYAAFLGYKDLDRPADALWRYIDRHSGCTLIVDLRRNGGGNYKTGRRLMVGPARTRLKSGKLRSLDVLIGNATFSAAMVNAIDFRKQCRATLVGEPIGERPNSYSERREMTLPHSRVVVTYSVRYYAFQRDDEPPAVMPDVQVEPTWEDFRAARDPVVEWVLAHRPGRG